jgi:hypothetical protein
MPKTRWSVALAVRSLPTAAEAVKDAMKAQKAAAQPSNSVPPEASA